MASTDFSDLVRTWQLGRIERAVRETGAGAPASQGLAVHAHGEVTHAHDRQAEGHFHPTNETGRMVAERHRAAWDRGVRTTGMFGRPVLADVAVHVDWDPPVDPALQGERGPAALAAMLVERRPDTPAAYLRRVGVSEQAAHDCASELAGWLSVVAASWQWHVIDRGGAALWEHPSAGTLPGRVDELFTGLVDVHAAWNATAISVTVASWQAALAALLPGATERDIRLGRDVDQLLAERGLDVTAATLLDGMDATSPAAQVLAVAEGRLLQACRADAWDLARRQWPDLTADGAVPADPGR